MLSIKFLDTILQKLFFLIAEQISISSARTCRSTIRFQFDFSCGGSSTFLDIILFLWCPFDFWRLALDCICFANFDHISVTVPEVVTCACGKDYWILVFDLLPERMLSIKFLDTILQKLFFLIGEAHSVWSARACRSTIRFHFDFSCGGGSCINHFLLNFL